MNIVVVGLSHKTAPVEIREKLAFSSEAMEESLRRMLELPGVVEGLILSTCNRVELYAVCRQAAAGVTELRHFLADYHRLSAAKLNPHLYDLEGAEAIRHVLRVSASLDSMVVGEPQILGQIKTAYNYACEFRSTGTILNRFMRKAFSVAKRVRNETQIASHAVSISFAAVELARKIFDSFEDKRVMLIGAGEMCELAAKHFVNNGVSEVLVTNRTFSRAEKLAAEFSGCAVPFERFADELHRVDIVLSSTGSPDYVLSAAQLKEVGRARRYQPMFIIDIAVPRDIDPAANKLNNLYLYDVDDLQGVVQANMKERQKEAVKAEKIIDEEVTQFESWLATLEVKPTIVALRRQMEDMRRSEINKTMAQLNGLGEDEKRAIDTLTSALINKILHHPTKILKQASRDPEGNSYVEAVRILFDLQTVSGPNLDADEVNK
jgi:glutamyl-tRNA reductase